MVRLRWILLALLFSACAHGDFPYRYYGIIPSEGKLLGDTPEHDLPLTTCEPDAQAKGKCWVFLDAELRKLQKERDELKLRLIACEQSCHPNGSQ